MHRVGAAWLACCLYWLAFPGAARADDNKFLAPGEEKLTLVIGGFLTGFDANLRVDDPALGSGTELDLNDFLSVNKRQSGVWAGVEWRFARRHRIGVNYTRFRPSSTTTLTRSIQIDGNVYPAGASLSTEFNLVIVPVFYSYSFVKRETDEIALTLGANWNATDFRAQGKVGPSGATLDTATTADFPLPLVGLRYDHHFSPRWSMGAQAEGFMLKVGAGTFDLNGTLWNARGQAEYRFFKHLSGLVAVDAFRINVDATRRDWRGRINYGFWGPQLCLKARF